MSAPTSPVVRHIHESRTVHMPHHVPSRLRVVLRIDGDAPSAFLPLIRFFLETNGARRPAYQETYARSLVLLLDHFAAHGETVEAASEGALQRFVDDLVCGTTDDDNEDATGLYWPRTMNSRVAAGHLSRISTFSDWAVERLGHAPLNPYRRARRDERTANHRRFERRANASLLGHAAMRRGELERAGRARVVQVKTHVDQGFEDVRAFDEGDFQRFMEIGWGPRAPVSKRVRARRLRNMMLSILYHAGGLRLSEPFHLYTGDVQLDPNEPGHALVWLFHPERGQAPNDSGGPWRDREEYLWKHWRLRPRNVEQGRFHEGWKNLALTDSRRKGTRVWFFPTIWGETFWRLFSDYRTLRPEGAHPFLFVSEREGERGEPYTASAFKQAHQRAVRRAGLPSGKNHGTSPHGHRHAYGLALANAGVDRRMSQKALHHRSPFSQDTYQSPRAEDIANALRSASEILEQSALTTRPRK